MADTMVANTGAKQQVFDPTLGRGINPDDPIGDRYGLDDILGFFVQSHVDAARSFVARVLSQINKRMVPGLGYAGAIAVQESRVCLLLDPERLAHLTLSEVLFVVHHEFVHLLHDHIPRFLDMRKMAAIDDSMRYIFNLTANLAMDMADNSYLRSKGFLSADGILGTGAHRIETVLPEHADLDDLKDYEYYQEMLLDEQIAEKLLKRFGGPVDWSAEPPEGGIAPPNITPLIGTVNMSTPQKGAPPDKVEFLTQDGEKIPDGVPQVYRDLAFRMRKYVLSYHFFVDDAGAMTGGEREGAAHEIRRQMRKLFRRAVKDHLRACGSGMGGMEEDLEIWLRDTRVPWQDILSPAISSMMSNKINESMIRPKVRRWPMFWRYRILPYPGTERALRYKLVFIIDTSGSMSTPELEEAIAEIIALCKRHDIDVQLWVIECDADVREDGVYLVKDDKIEPQFTDSFRIHGRGGTAFLPALRKAVELKPDVVVYYTDGGASVPTNPLEVPLFWLISPNGSDPGLPGTVLHMGKYI